MGFKSGKNIVHSQGLSCCFRQWRTDTHCHFLHGYSLQVEMEFEREDSGLDDRKWVMGFGDLKTFKKWLEEQFDHKTLVAKDDPNMEEFERLHKLGLIQMNIVENVGAESFAKMIYTELNSYLAANHPEVLVSKVIVREHEGNWASYDG
jgi:6-pyruvoyltetrahydropterin/6-carboxytetrahydropterin synthase